MVEPSGDLQKVFDRAVNSAKQWRHEYVTLEHLLYAMLDDTKFSNIVSQNAYVLQYRLFLFSYFRASGTCLKSSLRQRCHQSV